MSMIRYGGRAAALCALLAGSAAAHTWYPAGPDGGRLYDLVAARDGGGRVYALAYNGLHISTDAGRNWRAPQSAAPPPYTRSLVISPAQPLRLFAADATGRLLRSDDGGESWLPTGYLHSPSYAPVLGIAGDALFLSDLDGRLLRSVDGGVSFAAVQGWPADRALHLAATRPGHPNEVLAGVAYGEPASLYRSTDGGASWTSVYADPLNRGVTAIEYFDASEVIALLGGSLIRSSDGGLTWSPPQPLLGDKGRLLRLGGDAMVAVDAAQCWRSSDRFATRSDCSQDLRASHDDAPFGATVADDDGLPRVLATASREGVQVLDLQDSRWRVSNRRLQAEILRGLAMAQGSGPVFAGRLLSDNHGETLLGYFGGSSWERFLGDPAVGGVATLIRSIEIDPTSNPDSPTVYAAGRARLLPNLLSNSGIYKSDGGHDWRPLDSGLPPVSGGTFSGVSLGMVRKIALDPRSCAAPPAQGACTQGPLRRVFAVGDGVRPGQVSDGRWRVVRSDEGGENWTGVGLSLPAPLSGEGWSESVRPVDLEFDRAGTAIYLSVFADYYNDDGSPRIPGIVSGVFRSIDGGDSWIAANNGLPRVTGSATTTRDVFALAVHPRRSGTLWASTNEPGLAAFVHRSDDGGASWSRGVEIKNCDVRDLQVSREAPQVLLAAGVAVDAEVGCLWRSEDGGENWTALHEGLPMTQIYDVRWNPRDPDRLYVSGDRGIWVATVPGDRIFTDLEM